MEVKFATRNIDQQLTQYNYVVIYLLPGTAEELRGIIINGPEDNPYDTLKACLFFHISLNQSQRMQILPSLRPLGDLRPFQLLRQIDQLANKNYNGDIIL